MIHRLLNLTRPFFVLDTETTGTNADEDRIVELGFQEWNADGMIREWRSFIDPQVPIPASSAEVHKIDDAFIRAACRHCQRVHEGNEDHERAPLPTFPQLASSFARGFVDCDFGGQNVRFDLRILAKHFERCAVAWSYAGARVIDSYAIECALYPRDLSTLHERYAGRKHDGAHGALSDVRAAATVISLQLQGHEGLPRDLDALHALLWPGWLTADGSFRMVNGVPTICFGKHKGKAMSKVPRDYYDWLLRSSFPADVKALAQKAKLGELPS